VLRSERYYGSISRSFSLAQDIDAAKVQAKYVDGVLSLELPKKAQADTKKIAIQ
jgi:HSP20 family protein